MDSPSFRGWENQGASERASETALFCRLRWDSALGPSSRSQDGQEQACRAGRRGGVLVWHRTGQDAERIVTRGDNGFGFARPSGEPLQKRVVYFASTIQVQEPGSTL